MKKLVQSSEWAWPPLCVLQVVGGRLEAEVLQEQVWRGRDRWGFQAEGGPVVRGGSLLGTALLLPGNWSHTVRSVLCTNEHVFSSDVFFFFFFFFSCWEIYSHWFIKPLLHPDASFRNLFNSFLWTLNPELSLHTTIQAKFPPLQMERQVYLVLFWWIYARHQPFWSCFWVTESNYVKFPNIAGKVKSLFFRAVLLSLNFHILVFQRFFFSFFCNIFFS